MSTFKYETFEEAVHIAKTNLLYEGAGHSAALHSNNEENIAYAGKMLPVSRLVLNQPSSTGAGGSFFNGFAPTTTLGCGSWGNNSISENFDYHHLINISRIGRYNKDAKSSYSRRNLGINRTLMIFQRGYESPSEVVNLALQVTP